MSAKKDVGMNIKMNTKCFKDIILLEQGHKIDESDLLELVAFVNQRHDCADFRLICLIKTYIAYRQLLSEKTVLAMKRSMLDFKYWMDEPGGDGMCYWSENHQLLFAACEYLAGALFPHETFTNDGKTGASHKDKAYLKIMRWLKHRFTYGFTEWHSNTYYEEDIAPLSVLIDHSDDEEMVIKSKMILDLLLLDMAMHSYDGYFVATSGRCYENQKKDPVNADVNDILKHAFGILDQPYDYTRISAMFLLCKNYQVPEVIKHIAMDQSSVIIKDSMGLDLSEIKKEFPKKDFDEQGMFLWSMEAFTNKESINMTLDVYNAWNLKENNFLRDLEQVNIPIVRKLGLLPLVVRILNPATQGVAIERANTYTYKTKDYMLSTAQNYHPKFFGDQQHIWQATLPNRVSIFSTHPGSPMFDDAARNFSPSYWVGNGINPHAHQHENTLLLMYDLTLRKGYLERNRQYFVHFFFPVSSFDEIEMDDHHAFGRIGKSYVGIKSNLPIEQKDGTELIIRGKKSAFVVMVGSEDQYESFDNFKHILKSSVMISSHKKLSFTSFAKYALYFKKGFKYNGENISDQYQRYDTPYVKAHRKPEQLDIIYHNHHLILNFNQMERKEHYRG